MTLLDQDEPPPVSVAGEGGTSPFLFACDHAGRTLPRRLGALGLDAVALARHIAWDIGIAGTTRDLAARLNATAVFQTYSRLVVDCNRSPDVASSIVEISEATPIPGNVGLSAAARAARVAEIFRPYHDRIAALLDARAAAGQPTILISMHSFTPVFHGTARPWQVGLLYNRDARLAHALMALLRQEPRLEVGDNEPYQLGDLTDYTIPVHGEQRGLPHVEIEIRQDLIAEAFGQRDWAARLARLLPLAAARLGTD